MLALSYRALLVCWLSVSKANADGWPSLKNHIFTENAGKVKTLLARSTTECDIEDGLGIKEADRIGNLGVINHKYNGHCRYSTMPEYSYGDFKTYQGTIAVGDGLASTSYEAYKIYPPSSKYTKNLRSKTHLAVNLPSTSNYVIYKLNSFGSNAPVDALYEVEVVESGLTAEVSGFTKTSVRVDDLSEPTVYFVLPETTVPSIWPDPPFGCSIESATIVQNDDFDLYAERYDMMSSYRPFDPKYDWNNSPDSHYHSYSFRKTFFPVSKSTGENGVVWQDQETFQIYVSWLTPIGQVTVELPNNKSDYLGAAAGSGTSGDIIYLTMAKDGVEGTPLDVRGKKVDSSGNLIIGKKYDTTYLKTAEWSHPGSSLLWKEETDTLVWMFSRGLLNGHQGAIAVILDADTLDILEQTGQTSSHSWANSLIMGNGKNGHNFLAVELGDNFPRGISVHSFSDENERVSKLVYTFKTKHSTKKREGCAGCQKVYEEISTKDKTYYTWSNDNNVYTEIAHPGAIALLDGSYMVIFAGERPPLDNSKTGSNLNSPRNLAFLIVSGDIKSILSTGDDSSGGFYSYTGGWSDQENEGIVWLTDFSSGVSDRDAWHSAVRIKAAQVHDNLILIVYELWLASSYIRTEVMGINKRGKVVTKPTALPYKFRLTPSDDIEVVDGRAVIYGYNSDDKKLTRFYLNESTMDPPNRKTLAPTASNMPSPFPSSLPSEIPSISKSPSETVSPSKVPSITKRIYTFTASVPSVSKTLVGKKTTQCKIEEGKSIEDEDIMGNIGVYAGRQNGDGKCYTNGYSYLDFPVAQGVVDNGLTPVVKYDAYKVSRPLTDPTKFLASETYLLFKFDAPLAVSYTVYKVIEDTAELVVVQEDLIPGKVGEWVMSSVRVDGDYMEVDTPYVVIPYTRPTSSPTLEFPTSSPTLVTSIPTSSPTALQTSPPSFPQTSKPTGVVKCKKNKTAAECAEKKEMCIWNKTKKVKLCSVKNVKHLHDCAKYSDKSKCHKFCEWIGEECIHLCQASKEGLDCKSSKVKDKIKICRYKKVKNPLFQKCIDLEKPVTDAPSAAKLTPSPTVTETKTPTKRVTPSPTAVTPSPMSGCSDDEGGLYFFISKKGGTPNEVFRPCADLPEARKSVICAFTKSGVQDGVTHGPAKDVCRLTCGTCVTKTKTPTKRVTPSPTVATSSPTAVTSSPTSGCSDDEGGLYFFRSRKGGTLKEVFRPCAALQENRKSVICAFTESGVQDGVTHGPAKDVCRLTCGTCSGDGRTVSLKGL